MIKNNKIELIKYIYFISILLIGVLVLATLPRITIPLTISFIFYLVWKPIIPFFMRRGISRPWAYAFVIVGMILSTTLPIINLVPTMISETKNVERYVPQVENYVKSEFKKIKYKVHEKTGFTIEDDYLDSFLSKTREITSQFLLSLPKVLASAIEWFFLVPLFVFFLLKDGRKFKRLIFSIVPNSIFEKFYYLTHQFNKQLGDYIFAKCIEATLIGVVIIVGLLFLDIRFSLLLAFIAAITNVIPYIGPILGAVPALALVVVQYGVGTELYAVSLLYLIANAIDIAIVFPLLVSKIVNLHPLVVVLSVILGSQYLGVAGMIISIPLAAALKLIMSEIYQEFYIRKL